MGKDSILYLFEDQFANIAIKHFHKRLRKYIKKLKQRILFFRFFQIPLVNAIKSPNSAEASETKPFSLLG